MNKIILEKSYWLDNRLLQLNHNEFAQEAVVPTTKKEWEEARDSTIARLALAAGLLPEPDFQELNPRVWGHTEHNGIIMAKVSFESVPGLLCTGSLYLPKDTSKKAPGILCPYGHWQEGRFHNDDLGSLPFRCIRFAQLGFVVVCYDMLGKCDNCQIMHRPPLDQERLAELYGTTPFALQTWNSLRALDFLCNLPEVDANRIGCTGASGGGSQTWTVTALDQRIKVFSPVCMLSSHFQGGCICEEGPMLRITGLTSFDVIAACAPRPVILPSVTRDWTNLVPEYEYPALKQVYKLLGAPDNIKNFHADYPHNYNKFTREHVYAWFCHFLQDKPLKDTVPEGDVTMPPMELLAHNSPLIVPTPETHREALAKIERYAVKDVLGFTTDKKDFKEEFDDKLNLLSFVLNADPECSNIACRVTQHQWDIPKGHVWNRLLSRRGIGDIIPAALVTPSSRPDTKRVCLLLAPEGQEVFFDDEKYSTILDAVLDKQSAALTIDVLGTGVTKDMPEQSPRHANEEDIDFYAFNQSLFSMRVQDVITALRYLEEAGFKEISVIALGEAARVAACALPLVESVKNIILDLSGVSDSEAEWLQKSNFQPLIYKIGGLKGALSLRAPEKLTVLNADSSLTEHLQELFKTLGKSSELTIHTGTITDFLSQN
ncbi:MAG: acetylxylan esterase [Victivallales bacterium]|nr:acetylxylan esterase [Victivallales bacterium]